MKVTSKTTYAEFEQYENVLSDESKRDLMAAAEKQFKPCHMLTLDEFWGLQNRQFDLLGDISNPTVLQVYFVKRFEQFCEELTKALEALEIKDPNLQGTDSGCVKMSAQECMLLFVRSYFGLPSFEDAGKRTIGEYMLARKDRFNEWRLRKNYEQKQLAKLKSKKR